MSDPLKILPGTLLIGAWRFDPRRRLLSCGDRAVAMTPKAATLLITLAEAAPEPLTRDVLFAKVWRDVTVSDESLTQGISQLRRAFGQTGRNEGPIETIAKSGYRLAWPVSRVAERPMAQRRSNHPNAALGSIDAHLATAEARQIRERNGKGAPAQALELCRNATEMAPDYAPVLAEYAMAAADCYLFSPEGHDQMPHAIEMATRATELRPDLAAGHMALGMVLDAMGATAHALASFATALHHDGQDAECHYSLARTFYTSGDMARAARMALVAADLRRDDFRPLYLASGALAGLGDQAGSRMAAEQGLFRLCALGPRDPRDQRAQNILASLLARAGRTDDAMAELERYEAEDGLLTYYTAATLGWCGAVDMALDRLEETVEAGYRDFRWARNDPALAMLRRERRFQRLTSTAA
ncbi:hypothetical protein GTF97_08865 [Roseobacter sp. HKCCD8767]|uniref:winged helix-turn-helix domain-containing protein n=2 Tax=unclassified Roseobacter TaxID=196798 RepID=UPI001491D214|nr:MULTISPECIES: winged helix-turn-helix domain-containing protein [unclassified Roseobacter]NNV30842.1 hypothetical protein [Roseobacter sp. HKCCD9061]NNV68921.1 hypothetical protein [Roseobacter sp. HKCCD8474]NNV94704.1 hypothetical protein [Roseobacter sp. HKCCD8914]NNW11503.1 hypothetical protein [Roseobacter sp. HKCCD8484]NNW20025.1 hypothetical protein [Roseobacter sp. HKCCD7543]NNW36814.1 hypothetical protein [Roseobacter sp. HKCCD9117-2]NNW41331.1 hypothetical protein [Roseobacter sp